jgi:hypothetical protein
MRWTAVVGLGVGALILGPLSGCGASDEPAPHPSDTGIEDVQPDAGDTAIDTALDGAMPEDGEPTEDMGPADAGDAVDVEVVGGLDIVGMGVCEAYCATMEVACAGDDAVDFGTEPCDEACATWVEGVPTDTANDTASCRLYHATAALENPQQHCAYASPSGGGVCVTNQPSMCEQYCLTLADHCPGNHGPDFGSFGCEVTCESWPVGDPGKLYGATAHCHLAWAQKALENALLWCPHAGPGSVKCVDLVPECAVDEDCALGQTCEDEQCEGVALDCVVDVDCDGTQICEEGACVEPPEPECVVDGDCADDEVCTDGSCVEDVPPPECVDDDGCATGEVCDTGACVLVTYAAHIQPILAGACSPCHTSGNKGGTNFASSYADTQDSSSYCMGDSVGVCTLVRINDGSMPPNGNANLGTVALNAIETWIAGGTAP